MANAIIMTPGAMENALVLEGSTTSASMPWEQILELQPTDRARSTAINPAYVELDFTAATAVNYVALMFVNATNAATWRVRLATSKTNLLSSPSYDSGTMDVWMNKATVDYSGWARVHSFLDIGATHTRQYMRVDIIDSANPDSYIEVGRIYAGLKYQPPLNIQFGSSVPMPTEEVIRLESEGGLKHPVSRPRPMTASAQFIFESADELIKNLFDITRLRGVSQDILYNPFPGDTYEMWSAIYGTMSEPTTSEIPEYGIWTADLSFEELK